MNPQSKKFEVQIIRERINQPSDQTLQNFCNAVVRVANALADQEAARAEREEAGKNG